MYLKKEKLRCWIRYEEEKSEGRKEGNGKKAKEQLFLPTSYWIFEGVDIW